MDCHKGHCRRLVKNVDSTDASRRPFAVPGSYRPQRRNAVIAPLDKQAFKHDTLTEFQTGRRTSRPSVTVATLPTASTVRRQGNARLPPVKDDVHKRRTGAQVRVLPQRRKVV